MQRIIKSMEQAQLEQILLTITERLRNKYGKEPEVNHEGSIILREANEPNAPVIPEEVERLILDVIAPLGLNPVEWPFTTNNGNIVIRYTPR